MPSSPRVVVTDANILINLMHVGRLDLLGNLPAFTFVVPEQVVAEITDPGQQQHLAAALARGALRQEAITDLHELAIYAELRRIMGQGEAACLALAGRPGAGSWPLTRSGASAVKSRRGSGPGGS